MHWTMITDTTLPEEKQAVLVCIKDKKEESFLLTTAHRKKNGFYVFDFEKGKFLKLKRGLKVTHWATGVEIPR